MAASKKTDIIKIESRIRSEYQKKNQHPKEYYFQLDENAAAQFALMLDVFGCDTIEEYILLDIKNRFDTALEYKARKEYNKENPGSNRIEISGHADGIEGILDQIRKLME